MEIKDKRQPEEFKGISKEERNAKDKELVIAFQKGDDSKFNELCLSYNHLIKACAHSFFLVGGDSEDLVQYGMIGLFKAARTYVDQGDSAFSSYAYTCIQNTIYSAIKKANSQKNKPLTGYISIYSQNSEDLPFLKDPEEEIISRENEVEMWQKIESELSDFEVIVLKSYLTGHSYQEIGEELKKSPKSIDNALQRIKRKVGNIIAKRRK